MISGIWKGSTATTLTCAAVLCLALPSPARAADAPTAAQLVASLKRDVPARTLYTEVRFSSLLERPLVLRGELEYLGPGQLGKRVDTPYREQTKVANGEATVQRGDRAPRTFSLSQVPELEGFLRGFAALLGGDADALQRDFVLTSTGDAANWQLNLKPRDARLARRVSLIEVNGAGSTPRCFRTHEGDDELGVLLVDTLADAKLPVRPSQQQIEGLCTSATAR